MDGAHGGGGAAVDPRAVLLHVTQVTGDESLRRGQLGTSETDTHEFKPALINTASLISTLIQFLFDHRTPPPGVPQDKKQKKMFNRFHLCGSTKKKAKTHGSI